MSDVNATLQDRANKYGDYGDVATTAQKFKDEFREFAGWHLLNTAQRESLDMIATKIARILNGDPNLADNWHDIAGYAKLVEDKL